MKKMLESIRGESLREILLFLYENGLSFLMLGVIAILLLLHYENGERFRMLSNRITTLEIEMVTLKARLDLNFSSVDEIFNDFDFNN